MTVHEKNDFVEISKNLDTDLKIILSGPSKWLCRTLKLVVIALLCCLTVLIAKTAGLSTTNDYFSLQINYVVNDWHFEIYEPLIAIINCYNCYN